MNDTDIDNSGVDLMVELYNDVAAENRELRDIIGRTHALARVWADGDGMLVTYRHAASELDNVLNGGGS